MYVEITDARREKKGEVEGGGEYLTLVRAELFSKARPAPSSWAMSLKKPPVAKEKKKTITGCGQDIDRVEFF
mgnify:CR=1 FL=1